MDRSIDKWMNKLINGGIDLVYLPWVFIFLSGDSIYNPGGSVCLTTLKTKFSLNAQMQKIFAAGKNKHIGELNNCLKKYRGFPVFF